jgi:hydrogenase/urease accessory protein HupE
MAAAVYTLCALTALACAVLILRGYLRQRHRLLLWSGLCFCGMFVNNTLLILDRLALPDRDLGILRLVVALAALLPLLYGLVWEGE